MHYSEQISLLSLLSLCLKLTILCKNCGEGEFWQKNAKLFYVWFSYLRLRMCQPGASGLHRWKTEERSRDEERAVLLGVFTTDLVINVSGLEGKQRHRRWAGGCVMVESRSGSEDAWAIVSKKLRVVNSDRCGLLLSCWSPAVS
jgi:hypothetical protein